LTTAGGTALDSGRCGVGFDELIAWRLAETAGKGRIRAGFQRARLRQRRFTVKQTTRASKATAATAARTKVAIS
jgi:hypothetical protein